MDKSAPETPERDSKTPKAFYPFLGSKRLAEIDAWSIERFRSARMKEVKPITVNHDIDVLRAALSRAIEWKMLDSHPMRTIRRSKVDSASKVRYLSSDEYKRLSEALDAREEKRRTDREKFNEWRRIRGYKEFPTFGEFTDHLKPMVLLALNTGMRRGELFNLQWTAVNFIGRVLTVIGATAKSGKTRHIPLNDEAFDVLQKWHKQRKEKSELVFQAITANEWTIFQHHGGD